MNLKALFLSIFFGAIVFINNALAQEKSYSTVYQETKTDDSWSGTKKTSYSARLSKPDKGETSPLMLVVDRPNEESFFIIVKYETDTSDGKAFHKVMSGPAWGQPKWTSPSGNTDINWVYFNKNAYDIWAGESKPFDVQIEFADGSAVKYYISP
jgi:hypothetical protein